MNKKSDGIYISIKPIFVDLILKNEKNYEFRKYIPNKKIEYIYIYETLPKARIKYVINITEISKFPEKIETTGIGNLEFNKGLKKAKYAYKLGKIFFLEKEVELQELREKYNFIPPQSFAYIEKYKSLTDYINKNLKEL